MFPREPFHYEPYGVEFYYAPALSDATGGERVSFPPAQEFYHHAAAPRAAGAEGAGGDGGEEEGIPNDAPENDAREIGGLQISKGEDVSSVVSTDLSSSIHSSSIHSSESLSSTDQPSVSVHRAQVDASPLSYYSPSVPEYGKCLRVLSAIRPSDLLDQTPEHDARYLGAMAGPDRLVVPSGAPMALRHLRAEAGDVSAASHKMAASLRWRREFRVGEIANAFGPDGDAELRSEIAFHNSTGKMYVRGRDRDGRTILVMRPANENCLVELPNMRHLVYNLERAAASCRSHDGKMVIVMDFARWRLRNSTPMAITRHAINILQSHFPERLHRAFLCNTPTLFRGFWTVVSSFLDPVTKKKIAFVVGAAGKKTISDCFEKDLLEPCAGGTAARKFDSEEFLLGANESTFGDDTA